MLKFISVCLFSISSLFAAFTPFLDCVSKDWTSEHTLEVADFIKAYNRNHFSKVIPSEKPRIPKVIHHIWLGGKVPDVFLRYIHSWKRHHPKWEHILWTDKDIGSFPLITGNKIYETTNLGQRSDIFRLEILFRYGGLYVDTDFLCLKPHDILHHTCDFYVGLLQTIALNSFIASKAGHPLIKNYLLEINKINCFSKEYKQILHDTGPYLLNKMLHEFLKDTDEGIMVFPELYQYAFPSLYRFQFWESQNLNLVRRYLTPLAFSVHLWATSWRK